MNSEPNTTWAMKVPDDLSAGLDSIENSVAQFQAGKISEAEFRAIRVPQGIYEQRESGTYMLRVRCTAGGVLPSHLRKMGEVAAKLGNGVLHITTRQEFQVHRVPLDAILPALRALAEAGLSTRGGGGNTVRNVTACLDSGVCPKEVFDVAPYAVAATERLLADPLSLQLPRKYKIAFSGCDADCAGATVQDLGFVARSKDGIEGFAVYVGGGMGGKSRLADLLHDYIPASDAVLVAEAVKRVFDKHGDRKNKHMARLRFLVGRIGIDAFRDLYEKELADVRASNPSPAEVRPFPVKPPLTDDAARIASNDSPAFAAWLKHNVVEQKQPGYFMVHIPLLLGDLPADKAAELADIMAVHGDGALRATQSQNAALRWIAGSELGALFDKLDAIGLAEAQPAVLRNLVACAGASTCRLGICLSRGLAKSVRWEVADSSLQLDDLGNLSIHISGCPNSCGRHPVGNIGLSGAARWIDEKMVPYYSVQLGGRVGVGETRFGMNVGAVPARNAPAFIRELLSEWQASGDAADFHRFIDNGGRQAAEQLIEKHQQAPVSKQNKNFNIDWDARLAFSLTGHGAGECSAGVFDLIEIDLANAREALEAGRLHAAALAACHALLVTKGRQSKHERDTFDLFQQDFVAEGLVDRSLAAVVSEGARSAGEREPADLFAGDSADVAALVANVRQLYESMDASLRLKVEAEKR